MASEIASAAFSTLSSVITLEFMALIKKDSQRTHTGQLVLSATLKTVSSSSYS